MRRKDREVTDLTALKFILDTCKVCRVGMVDEQGIYIVPVNFGYEFVDEIFENIFPLCKRGQKDVSPPFKPGCLCGDGL